MFMKNTFSEKMESWKNVSSSQVDYSNLSEQGKRLRRDAHFTLQYVTEVYEKTFSFNTAVARVMELCSSIRNNPKAELSVQREASEILLFCMSPMAPHLCEELWSLLDKSHLSKSIFLEKWPIVDQRAISSEEKELSPLPDAEDDELIKKAEEVSKTYLEGKEIVKHIVVKGRLVNIIVKD